MRKPIQRSVSLKKIEMFHMVAIITDSIFFLVFRRPERDEQTAVLKVREFARASNGPLAVKVLMQ